MSHYEWLKINFGTFLTNLGHPELMEWNGGIISAHGDKCYCYRYSWDEAGIPFPHGVAIYFLSYMKPWSDETRELSDGTWVDVGKWVIEKYPEMVGYLPPV